MEEKEIERLINESESKKHDLQRHAESGYSEVFYALIHLKYLRLYVESCLKYTSGDYYSVMVFVAKDKEQKLNELDIPEEQKEELRQNFVHQKTEQIYQMRKKLIV